jgi:hypothetical protein
LWTYIVRNENEPSCAAIERRGKPRGYIHVTVREAFASQPIRKIKGPRPVTNKTKVGTGKRLHNAPIDGRTRWARRYAEVYENLTKGLRNPDDEQQRQLCRRAAAISISCERLEAQIAAGKDIDGQLMGEMTDRLLRVTRAIERDYRRVDNIDLRKLSDDDLAKVVEMLSKAVVIDGEPRPVDETPRVAPPPPPPPVVIHEPAVERDPTSHRDYERDWLWPMKTMKQPEPEKKAKEEKPPVVDPSVTKTLARVL